METIKSMSTSVHGLHVIEVDRKNGGGATMTTMTAAIAIGTVTGNGTATETTRGTNPVLLDAVTEIEIERGIATEVIDDIGIGDKIPPPSFESRDQVWTVPLE